MKKTLLITSTLLAFGFISCDSQNKTTSEVEKQNIPVEKNISSKSSYISLFEIPATDISRAVNFYQTILDIKIETMEMPGMEMGIFPYEEQMVTGVIMKGEGYTPSADGLTLYLDGGNDLQIILNKIEENGGEIIVTKTPHADESGFFALFLDTEGNKIGLNSPN